MLWGEHPEDRGEPDIVNSYEFETLREVEAFLLGARESTGWGDFAWEDELNEDGTVTIGDETYKVQAGATYEDYRSINKGRLE